MFKHNYIAARVDRRTYLKGRFVGKFVGRLDQSNSDSRYQRYYDLEILEGEVETSQDDLVPWMENKAPAEFSAESTFPVNIQGKINVTLHHLNGERKYFKIALKQIKLKDCHLSDQIYGKKEVYGTIQGLISGYVLHHDMLVNEISEEEPPKQQSENVSGESGIGKRFDRTSHDSILIKETSPGKARLFQLLSGFIGLGLIIAALLVAKNWVVTLLGISGIGLLIRWLKRLTTKRYGAKISGSITTLLIVFTFIIFAFYVAGHYQDYSFSKAGKTNQAVITNPSELKQKAADFFERKHYQDAIELYDQLLEIETNDADLRYQRALCYTKVGRISDAVEDLRLLVSNGDTAAITLHNQINPVKTRQVGTQIRCNDGTISHSQNRKGTCSHHGGVKDWEEPVFEEYREY